MKNHPRTKPHTYSLSSSALLVIVVSSFVVQWRSGAERSGSDVVVVESRGGGGGGGGDDLVFLALSLGVWTSAHKTRKKMLNPREMDPDVVARFHNLSPAPPPIEREESKARRHHHKKKRPQTDTCNPNLCN